MSSPFLVSLHKLPTSSPSPLPLRGCPPTHLPTHSCLTPLGSPISGHQASTGLRTSPPTDARWGFSLCINGYLRTYFETRLAANLQNVPAFAFQVLELKTSTTKPGSVLSFGIQTNNIMRHRSIFYYKHWCQQHHCTFQRWSFPSGEWLLRHWDPIIAWVCLWWISEDRQQEAGWLLQVHFFCCDKIPWAKTS